MKDSLREDATRIVRRLQDAGFAAFWVGGCVRDFLLDREPGDYDIATSAEARSDMVERNYQMLLDRPADPAGLAHWLAAAGMTAYAAGAMWALVPAVREMRARPPRSAPAWALLAGSGWLLAASAADAAGLAAGAGSAGRVLDHLLVPVVGAGVVGQILTGALTFLLPVTVGGGPAGNRRLTAILETGWRSRAVLGNAGVLALAVLPAHGAWRTASWAAVLTGFGSFPLLMAAALATARGSARQRALPLPVAAEAADGSPEPRDRQ